LYLAKDILNRYTLEVEATIQQLLAETLPFLRGTSRYHLGLVDRDFQPLDNGRGKMLRPTLHLLVFEAICGNYQAALPVAAALELIHSFSLVHDDVEDNGLERRGRATVWTIWGKERTINIGDFLFALAFKALHQLDLTQFSPQTVIEVSRLVSGACVALTEGQELDMSFETGLDISVEMYLDMIYRKTGALIEASVLSGAKLATSDPQVIAAYHMFGRNIGLAFQVRDDILGIWGDTHQTGKSVSDDLRHKKKTLPIIYAFSQLTGERGEKFRAMYAQPNPLTDSEIEFVRDSLTVIQAEAYTQKIATQYHEQAFIALHQVKLVNEAQAQLEALALFLVNRTY